MPGGAFRVGAEGAIRPGAGRAVWVLGGVLAAAVLAAYAGTFSVPFLFDDDASIASNPTIRHLADALWPPVHRTVTGRPLLNLTLALNYALGGTRVWGYHAVNLAIHVGSALLLFGIVHRTLAGRAARGALAVGFFTALAWALHPIGTGAVTYIVQRAESLMAFLYLLTLYGLVRGSGSPGAAGSRWLALSVAACALGMATKEAMASAPLVALLYDRTFVAGSFRGALRARSWTYAGLSATWLLLAFLVATTAARTPPGGGPREASWQYALTQGPALTHYLRLCLWPNRLVFDYGTPLAAPCAAAVLRVLAVAGLLCAGAWGLLRNSAAGFLISAFFLILAPSSSFVPVAGETMADYRMYLPLACLAAAAAAGGRSLLGRAFPPVFACLCLALGWATYERNRDYRSEESIWADTVAKAPANPRALGNLAGVLSRTPGRAGEAITLYESSLRLDPGSAETHVDLGNLLSGAPGGRAEAAGHYRAAIALEPNLYGAYIGLGNLLSQDPRRLEEAAALFGTALRLRPYSYEGHFNLGNVLSREPGRTEAAVAQYEEALRLRPDSAKAHFSLAVALLRTPGREREAEAELVEGLRYSPDDAQARRILSQLRSGPR
jgi:tetratricopeptide (TPR) repeat protein